MRALHCSQLPPTAKVTFLLLLGACCALAVASPKKLKTTHNKIRVFIFFVFFIC